MACQCHTVVPRALFIQEGRLTWRRVWARHMAPKGARTLLCSAGSLAVRRGPDRAAISECVAWLQERDCAPWRRAWARQSPPVPVTMLCLLGHWPCGVAWPGCLPGCDVRDVDARALYSALLDTWWCAKQLLETIATKKQLYICFEKCCQSTESD